MNYDPEELRRRFHALAPAVDYCGLRVVEESSVTTSVRQDVAQPCATRIDRGAMVTVVDRDGVGYAAGSDVSAAGLRDLLRRARDRARLTRSRSVFGNMRPRLATPRVQYCGPGVATAIASKAERLDILMRESRACRIDPRIVDWQTSLATVDCSALLLTLDGGQAVQRIRYMAPSLHVVAHASGRTQVRSLGGRYIGFCQQGGMDVLDRSGFAGCGRTAAEQALQLLTAANCPTGKMDLILMPDQMMLQIHESIGHPIELDRILGDERNFAGTSFVTPEMFGNYRYGSQLLNVTFDPSRTEEFASFAVDDEGTAARREFLIRDGVLLRPLGGTLSWQRARASNAHFLCASPVASSRASSWNRPPIDRMSNLNVEPGASSLEEMIASVDDGVLMRTNTSWSIDDSRNKFQFGCEWGQKIRHGRLAEVVRNPNYRGISATFWRSLSMVGDPSTFEVWGSPFCGKGEPSQIIRVGHASPACKFSGVDVFGAET